MEVADDSLEVFAETLTMIDSVELYCICIDQIFQLKLPRWNTNAKDKNNFNLKKLKQRNVIQTSCDA